MKKILSLLLVALMLVGMLPMNAINANAAESATSSMAVVGTTGVKASDSSSISWTNNVITFTNYKAGSSTAIRNSDSNHYRVYGKSEVEVVAPGNITSIVITSSESSYVTPWCTSAESIGTATSSGKAVTIVPTTPATSIRFTASAQVRLTNIEVTYEVAGGDDTCAHANTSNVEATPAGCETPGYNAGVYCNDCESYIEGHEVIAATGHNFGEWSVVTAATCTEAGEQTRACQNEGCDKTETETIAALGHTYVDGTCTGCGNVAAMAVYELVTDAASLKAGDQLIFVGANADGAYSVMIPYDSGNNLKAESIDAPVDGKISLADTSAAAIITLGGDSAGWTFFDGTYYLYSAGTTKSNYLKGKTELPDDNTGAWTIAIDESGVATIINVGNNAEGARNVIKFNYGNSPVLFANYASTYTTKVNLISLYRVSTGEPEVPGCSHANTTKTTVDATCTAVGSETVVCDDCGETVSTTELPKLNHTYVNDVCSVCGAEFEGEVDTTDPEEPKPAGGYELATYISVGDQIVIVASDSDVAMSTNQKSNNRGQASVTKDGNKVTFGEDVQVLTVEAGTKDGTFAFNTGSGYLYAASSGNNYLRTETALSDNSSWTVIITDGVASIVAQGTNTRNVMQYNLDSSLFACYASASQKAISLYKYVAAGTCEHSWGEWAETTAPTCTDAGVETATCTLCGETKTQSVAATGHTYTYVDGSMTCTCGDSKTISAISEAKAYTSKSQVYYIKGIVTYVSGKTVYIEDATGGICVYFATADAASGIALGDEIVVWDTMTTYNGLIETTNTLETEYLKVSSGNALPSQTVTIADLLADETNEYLGERVVIENVTMGTINTSDDTALTDADGNTINIYKVPALNEEINENDIVTVTAIVSTYNGYQLAVNSADDVVEVKDGAATVIETVTIADAKAGTVGEYYQVEGTVTYISGRNVYIQDTTGGIVVYLTANAATTQVGDNVKAYGALKLYEGLIELDGIDETNTQFYEILSSGNTVGAQEVTIEGLLADTSNEYLAEKITLNNVYVSYYDYFNSYGSYYVTYTLVDGNGNSIKIYKVPVASEEDCVAGGSIVNVEAIVSTYNGYQLVTDNAKITVTGTCAHETTELVNDKDATLTAGGYTGDTMCTVCGNYTERGEDTAALTDVDSWGLTLGGDILVNFKIALAESIKDTAQITVAVADKTYTYAAKDYYADGYVYVSASVAAAQMTDEITVTVINGDDQAEKSGYTIKSYADTILNGDYDDATKALVTAMLHYGAAAQTFFNYKTEAMANADLTSAEDVTIPADAAGEIEVSGSAEGITFYGASLVFENKIAVRFYFNVTGDIADYTFTKDGTKYEPVAKKGMYYIEIAGINPQDLDDAVTVTVGELSVSYSPMNYIVRMAENSKDEDLVALVKALYSYHVAAQAYATANAV